MAIKIKSVRESVKDNGLKALVHAPAGTGKTVLCATACEPTLIISAEAGLLSLNQEDVQGSPTFDPQYCDVVEVQTIDDLSDVYDMLEAQVLANKRKYSWVNLDSITEIAETVLENEKKANKDPRAAYGNLQTVVLALLKSFRDLPKYNVLMTSKQTRFTDDVSGVTTYIPMMPGAKLSQQIPYLFDEVWCLRVGKDEDKNIFHYIQAIRDNQYEAKDRSGKLSDVEPPSLKMLMDRIYGEDRPVFEPYSGPVDEPEEVEAEESEESEEAVEPVGD